MKTGVCQHGKNYVTYRSAYTHDMPSFELQTECLTWVLRSRVAEMCATELSPLVEHCIEAFITFSQSVLCDAPPSCSFLLPAGFLGADSQDDEGLRRP